MAVDIDIKDHQAWLGYLQPDGLVVSPAALVDAQVTLDRNNTKLQQAFLDFIHQVDDDQTNTVTSSIDDLPAFFHGFLQWPQDCLIGDRHSPIPDPLRIPLANFGETLAPDYALLDPHSPPDQPQYLLLIQDHPDSVDLDAPVESAMAGWSASPTRRFERLLRETQIPIGLITNRTSLRLVYAPRGENAGTLTFPVSAMAEIAGRPILAALHTLLSKYRLLSAPTEARLPALLKRSRDYQGRVSTQLAGQVLDALYELLRGYQSANERTNGRLLADVLQKRPDSIYNGLLTVLMRLVFLLYAEDRGLMPGSDLYVRNYALHGLFEQLRNDQHNHPDTMDHRYGAWARLLALFRIVHEGCRHPLLAMPAREGHLFDPDRFPFLEGRNAPDDPTGSLPMVADGHIHRILEKLLILDGERLSYRTLDVEQIGSVYETMMGFRLHITDGRTIALKPAKSQGAPVPVNLEQLLAANPAKRSEVIKQQTDTQLPPAAANAVRSAGDLDDLLIALDKRIARNATPHPLPAGAMVLSPTDERRRTGSHYTPRSLTQPIVAKALEPILKQLGEHPEPDQILNLKVCDPAMGSGAFLVEACRQLADQLVQSWDHHGYKPRIPDDEDQVLYARRLIAQRCLYGVDRNPMAVDLAKLSLWLATLARDHPFTFLDHALRAGDSLVGVDHHQIAYFNFEGRGDPIFVQERLKEQISQALAARRQILAAGDEMPPANKAQKLQLADEATDLARLAGDLLIASFFNAAKAKERDDLRNTYLGLLEDWKQNTNGQAFADIQAIRNKLRSEPFPVTPFHWDIEFPEVFQGDQPGFDCIVGNPPFAGKNNLINSNRPAYSDWLKHLHAGSHGNADLVAHFFRRSFTLLCPLGTFGLIATNTIAQGDTRATGLRPICTHGGTIYAARKRLKWPGLAAVVVSVVHIRKGQANIPCELDGRVVPTITAYLFHAGSHDEPEKLLANQSKSFIGSYLLGMGFTFDDTDKSGVATPLAEMHRLIEKNPANAQCIFPYIGGEEINTHPRQQHHRYVINFGDRSLEEVRERWPDLLEIVERKVKPARAHLTTNAIGRKRAQFWWQYGSAASELYAAIAGLPRVLGVSRVGQSLAFAFLNSKQVFSDSTVITAFAVHAAISVLQSRPHEIWARFFASSLEDRLRYTPTDCFETFPFPPDFEANPKLEQVGQAYYEFRADLMVRNDEGLTKTYNRFHNPAEGGADIQKLRELHAAMDGAVLEAYGWSDLKPVCGFGLDYLELEDDQMPADLELPEELWWPTAAEALAFAGKLPPTRKRLPWRHRWNESTRDDVLARLLELNKQRAEEERRTGQSAAAAEKKKTKKSKRGQKKVAVDSPDLFTKPSAADGFEPVPILEAVELMVAILDDLAPTRVQQVAAERMFILAVSQHARQLYEEAGKTKGEALSQPGTPFRTLWQTVTAAGYATISDAGIVTRTDQAVTLTNSDHARMAKEAIELFKQGEAMKRSWPVEVDNVRYIFS